MRVARLARQLLLLNQQQGCSSSLAAHRHLLPAAAAQQRLYHAALAWRSQDDAASTSASRAPAGRAQQQSEEEGWTPQRSLPTPSYYGVKVTIKAHDLKFVKLASTVIRDLMLVNFAPKSRDVIPPEGRKASKVPHIKLAMPMGDAALPTKRTHYTVIRGPHVHKSSREQFARTTHQRAITYATNNQSELNWFLDSLKLYKFIGVELIIRVTSSSYLLPTSSSQQADAEQPLLLQHKQRFAHLFGAAAPSSTGSSSNQPQQQQAALQDSSASYAALQQSLQGLRQSIHRGLLQQRLKLSGSPFYQRWKETREGATAAEAAAAGASPNAAAAGMPGVQLENAVSQQLQGSSMASPAQQQAAQQAFIAAVDKAMLRMKLDVLDRHKFYPYMMAFYQLGQQQMPAAEWMQAVLKFGKARQQEVESSQQAAALQAYQQYGQVNQTLLLLLLQQWHAAADGSSRRELVMPDAERVAEIMHMEKKNSSK